MTNNEASAPTSVSPSTASASSPTSSSSSSEAPQPSQFSHKLRLRWKALIEGVRYILGHPLLPGLYVLDWSMTLVSYYRELLPMFVAQLFTHGREDMGLSERGAVSVLLSANYAGAVFFGLLTMKLQDCDTKYGRQVLLATLAYGGGCILFGATSEFAVGIAAIFLCGGFDAVGMVMRSLVVMITTPDNLRGRASSGHSLAAGVANALGHLYVANMASWIGPGETMVLGGLVTIVLTGLAVWRIPALLEEHGTKRRQSRSPSQSGLRAAGKKHGYRDISSVRDVDDDAYGSDDFDDISGFSGADSRIGDDSSNDNEHEMQLIKREIGRVSQVVRRIESEKSQIISTSS
eukprot:CAMPEP_0197538724 /NCGR_PEP_ID=MMETSP1318-20131121/60439_1 /TAXON_ID=552666 /ORGANISM="Partenskyella glossopodia, Strain RCC365" /LENGTH=347 /DNA_ID=CAMNT_0043097215 /DNA_START=105 /DNA_END=1148 /DNA_ORIENTATION=-